MDDDFELVATQRRNAKRRNPRHEKKLTVMGTPAAQPPLSRVTAAIALPAALGHLSLLL